MARARRPTTLPLLEAGRQFFSRVARYEALTRWTKMLLNRVVAGEPVIVPAHWSIEVTNGLLIPVRRGRLPRRKIEEFMKDIGDLPVQIESARSPDAWPALVALAEKHRLTTYDAAYLELAQRAGLPLATLDNDLRKAAQAKGAFLVAQL